MKKRIAQVEERIFKLETRLADLEELFKEQLDDLKKINK